MPLRILVALLVLIAAPLLLLGWVSVSTMRADRAATEQQIESVLRSRLAEIDASLQVIFDEVPRQLTEQVRRALAGSSSDTIMPDPQLTRIERTEPMVRHLILVNSSGRMIYPPPPNVTETTRIEEYAALTALAGSRPRASRDEASRKSMMPMVSGTGFKASSYPPPLAEPVYHVWYRDEGTQLSLWWPYADGSAIGVMLERSRWMAEMTARLPDTLHINLRSGQNQSEYPPATAMSSRDVAPTDVTTLCDESNRIVYRWGSDMELASVPAVELALTEPLSSWRLRYYTQQPLISPVRFMGLYAALAGLGIVLFALGGYVLTHLQRQIRLAKNRITFAGQVSHELRTPLTNILLYAELARADLKQLNDQAAAAIAPRLAIIDSESRRLSRLVSGVMEIIREDSRARPLRLLPHHADSVIDDVVMQFAPSFAAAGLKVHRTAEANRWVQLDKDCVEMILVNLLSNVEKYAAGGGWVRIESAISHDRLTVRVADNGPGIAARHQRTVFKAFRRLDDSISAPSGTGIGLTIARRLARRHGGDVRLVPTPDGACFEVTLAVSAAEMPAASDIDPAVGEAACNFES